MRILNLLLALFFIISCNSNTEKENATEKPEMEEKKEVQSSAKNETKEQKSKETKPLQFKTESDESILFSEIQQLKSINNQIKIFKGISTNLMGYILVKYITDKHIDPSRYENFKDSITLNLSEQTFTFYRLSPSQTTEYDVEIHEINYRHRLSFGDSEEMTEEEIKEWDEEHQLMIEGVDSALMNVERYDRLVVRGSWSYKDLKDDYLFLDLAITIVNLDPIEFDRYGENLFYVDDEINDELKIDLFESIYSLGQNKKFNETDLNIFDSEDLAYIRNQFYARKGYIFKTEKMKNFFETKPWYKGVSDNVNEEFNQTELENIYFIKDKESNKK